MKNNIIKILAASFLLCFYFFTNAQEAIPTDLQIKELKQEIKTLNELVRNNNNSTTSTTSKNEAPISNNYAVGKNGKLFAVINPKENTIEILSKKDGELLHVNQVLIDRIDGIYNIEFIYRGQNVEIYDDNIIYLASNCDSSILRVLDLKGNQINEVRFFGQTSSFSYDPSSKSIFIAGNNTEGFDFITLDASKGFENLSFKDAPVMHYAKPKKADVIKLQDPKGVIVTVISFSIVFIVLILVVLVIIGSTKSLTKMDNRKIANENAKGVNKNIVKIGLDDLSDDQYAAIAAALYLYQRELHDEENSVLTINKVAKVYSPWSSKLYNMNQYKR